MGSSGQAEFLLLLWLLTITTKTHFTDLTWPGGIAKVYLQNHLGLQKLKGHRFLGSPTFALNSEHDKVDLASRRILDYRIGT